MVPLRNGSDSDFEDNDDELHVSRLRSIHLPRPRSPPYGEIYTPSCGTWGSSAESLDIARGKEDGPVLRRPILREVDWLRGAVGRERRRSLPPTSTSAFRSDVQRSPSPTPSLSSARPESPIPSHLFPIPPPRRQSAPPIPARATTPRWPRALSLSPSRTYLSDRLRIAKDLPWGVSPPPRLSSYALGLEPKIRWSAVPCTSILRPPERLRQPPVPRRHSSLPVQVRLVPPSYEPWVGERIGKVEVGVEDWLPVENVPGLGVRRERWRKGGGKKEWNKWAKGGKWSRWFLPGGGIL